MQSTDNRQAAISDADGKQGRFDPSKHLIQLKGKDYLPVQFRLVWFRAECPNGTIETEIVHLDFEKETEEEVIAWNPTSRRSEKSIKTAKGLAVVRATVRDGKGGVATGTKMEKAASFGDWLEKAETGAIGRALAALGFGTQFAPELNEEHRIADSPVQQAYADGTGETTQTELTFDQRLAQVKRRAQKLGVVSTDEEWPALLKKAGKTEIKTLSDLASVNGYLTKVERERNAQPA